MISDRTAFIRLPHEVLTKVFSHLAVEDLLRAMAVCKSWRQTASSESLWQGICRQRWRLWSSTPTRCERVQRQLQWREVCQYRMETDGSARVLVAAMVWPLKRPSCLRRLISLGDLVVEELERLALKEGHLEEATRFFANLALDRIAQSKCVKAMEELLTTPQLEDHLARGALLIAKLRFLDLDISAIESRLDEYGITLRRRLQQDPEFSRLGGLDTPNGTLVGLKQLNTFLFGQLHNHSSDEDHPSSESSFEDDNDSECLRLRGNKDDIHNPANFYINEVLETRKGAEISLAILHSVVGRRCGIPVQVASIPMSFLTKVGEEFHKAERFVNVFEAGRLLQRNDCIDVIQRIGLNYEPRLLSPIPPSSVFIALCEHLIALYRQADGEDAREGQRQLLPLLDLLLAMSPGDCPNRFRRAKLLLEMPEFEDFEAAIEDLEALLNHLPEDAGGQANHGMTRALLRQFKHRTEDRREQHAAWCSKRRIPRPSNLLYRVGNVVRHARLQYVGVIFGWDPHFMLDEDYVSSMRVDQLEHGRNQPFYRVLVDQNYRNTATYGGDKAGYLIHDQSCHEVAQENIILAPEAGPLSHEESGLHFLGYQAGGYVLNAYLSYLYPEDAGKATNSRENQTTEEHHGQYDHHKGGQASCSRSPDPPS